MVPPQVGGNDLAGGRIHQVAVGHAPDLVGGGCLGFPAHAQVDPRQILLVGRHLPGFTIVVDGERDDLEALVSVERVGLLHVRKLHPARAAPRRPEVEQHVAAVGTHLRQLHRLAFERLAREVQARVADRQLLLLLPARLGGLFLRQTFDDPRIVRRQFRQSAQGLEHPRADQPRRLDREPPYLRVRVGAGDPGHALHLKRPLLSARLNHAIPAQFFGLLRRAFDRGLQPFQLGIRRHVFLREPPRVVHGVVVVATFHHETAGSGHSQFQFARLQDEAQSADRRPALALRAHRVLDVEGNPAGLLDRDFQAEFAVRTDRHPGDDAGGRLSGGSLVARRL